MEVVASALAIIASLVAGGRWLIKAYFDQTQTLLQTKKDLYQERFERLKEVTEDLEKHLNLTSQELAETRKLLHAVRSEVEQAKIRMVKYIESNEKRTKVLESQVIKLTEELFMVTSKSKG